MNCLNLAKLTVIKKYSWAPGSGWWRCVTGKITVGLALHCSCVTNVSGLTAYGPMTGRWTEHPNCAHPLPLRQNACTYDHLSDILCNIFNKPVINNLPHVWFTSYVNTNSKFTCKNFVYIFWKIAEILAKVLSTCIETVVCRFRHYTFDSANELTLNARCQDSDLFS